jgi:tetratricopeptide (TPR) repeat protein
MYLALNGKACVLMDDGRYSDAEHAFQESLRIKTTPNVLMNLGSNSLRQGDYRQAEIYYRKALIQDHDFFGAYSNLGHLLLLMQRNSEAAEAFRHAQQLRPDSGVALYGLALALSSDGKLDEALQQCTQAGNLSPDDDEPMIAAGASLLEAKKFDEAISQFQSAINRKNDLGAHLELALAELAKGDLAESRLRLEMLLTVPPNRDDSARIHRLLAVILEKQGDLESSAAHADESIRLGPWLKYDSLDDVILRQAGVLTAGPAAVPDLTTH